MIDKPKKKKRIKRNYFTEETEDAIVLYNQETNYVIKNKIYNNHIKDPLEKLVEYVINTFKFSYLTETLENKKVEVISHLLVNFDKYNKDKGKAFSYFSVAAKRYLIINNNISYKKLKTEYSITYNDENNKVLQIPDENNEENFIFNNNIQLIKYLVDYINKNKDLLFKKEIYKKISSAVLQLIENYNTIENFNKKSIYILLKEMTNENAQNITKVLNIYKVVYKKLKNEYNLNGEIPTNYNHLN